MSSKSSILCIGVLHKTESPGSVEKFYQLQSGLGLWTVVLSLRCLIMNDSLSWLAALHHGHMMRVLITPPVYRLEIRGLRRIPSIDCYGFRRAPHYRGGFMPQILLL